MNVTERSENWISSLAQAPEDLQPGDHRKIPSATLQGAFFLGGTEKPGKWQLDAHAAGERQDFIDFIILEKFVKCLLECRFGQAGISCCYTKGGTNTANALSQLEQKNYCFPGVMGIADTAKEEAEL